MQATIAQADLVKAFKALKLTLPPINKAILPACSCIHLKADSQAGKVIATTFDSNSFTQVELPAQNVVDGERLINGAKLMTLVNRFGDGDVELDAQGQFQTKLTHNGGTPVTLVGMDPALYPTLPTFNPTQSFTITTDELKLLVNRTAWARARKETDDSSLGVLAGVELAVRDDGNGNYRLAFSATDRIHAAYKSIPVQSQAGEFALVVMGDQLQEVVSIMPPGEVCTISWDDAFVMFQAGGITYFGRQLGARYPNLKGHFDRFRSVMTSTFTVSRHELLSALSLVDVIVSGDAPGDNQAVFTFGANGLTIHGHKEGVGDITESVSGTLSGSPIELEWKVPIVMTALKAMGADEVVFELPSQSNMASVIRPKDDDEELYLVLAVARR